MKGLIFGIGLGTGGAGTPPADTLSAVLAAGNTSGGNNIVMTSGDDIDFGSGNIIGDGFYGS